MKTCRKCGETKSLDGFYTRKDGLVMAPCISCRRVAARAAYRRDPEAQRRRGEKYRQEHPDRAAASQRRYLYGISPEAYDEMLCSQGGVCALCGETNLDGHPLYVDHDHRCCAGRRSCGKCIRALLCRCCNAGIGHLRDDTSLMLRAIEYVEKFR